MATAPKKRPIGVTILAILAILAAILFFLAGPALLTAADTTLQALGGLIILMGILYLVGAIGLLKLTAWGWWLAIIASLISVISNIVQGALFPGGFLAVVPGLIIALIILLYLFLVRGHFGIGA